MADLQCKLEIPKAPGLADNELTVGREFFLECQGEVPKDLDREKVQFVLKPEQKYQIHLLGFEFRDSTTVDIKATSYLAGQHKLDALSVTDGVQVLNLGTIEYAVASVLKPQEAPQPGQQPVKQEPYGPIGPAVIGIPLIYWGAVLGALAAVVLVISFRLFRVAQRRRMLEKLREHDSALSPIAQYHQNMRRLQRENTVFFGGEGTESDVLRSLDDGSKFFKLYLTRRFRMPAMEWSDRLIVSDLKRYHKKVYSEFGSDIKKMLKEYSRAFQDKKNLKTADVLNLTKANRKLVESLERGL